MEPQPPAQDTIDQCPYTQHARDGTAKDQLHVDSSYFCRTMGVTLFGLILYRHPSYAPCSPDSQKHADQTPHPQRRSTRWSRLYRGKHQEQRTDKSRKSHNRGRMPIVAKRISFGFFRFLEYHTLIVLSTYNTKEPSAGNCARGLFFLPYIPFLPSTTHTPTSRRRDKGDYLYSFQALIFKSSRPLRQKDTIKSLAKRALVISGILKSMAERRIV